MSQIYVWECLDCGLLNYNSQCKACFSLKTTSNPTRITIGCKRNKNNICGHGWFKRKKSPHGYRGYISSCTQDLKLIQGYGALGDGIYEYNCRTNEWKQIFTFPIGDGHYRYQVVSVEYNERTNKIYVESSNNESSILLQIDPQTHRFEVQQLRFAFNGRSILIKGKQYQLPIRPPQISECHERSAQFDRICITCNDHPDSYWHQHLRGYELLYIPYRDELVAIGGMRSYIHVDTIHSYSFSNKLWSQSDMVLLVGLSYFGCVLTNNQQFIIMMGGFYNTEVPKQAQTDMIFVWDLKRNTIKQSKVRCPLAGNYRARITPIDIKWDVLICGYLRKYCVEDLDNRPLEVIHTVHRMYDIGDEVHLFDRLSGDGHWIISVDDILASLL